MRRGHLLALLSSGTLVVCGVKAPPQPPLAQGQDAGPVECTLEARQALERTRVTCPGAVLDDACRITCGTEDGGTP